MNVMKMYIFVNNDLKMDKGKACAQVGHAVQYITEEIISGGNLTDSYKRYMECKKILLEQKLSSKRLLKIC